MENYLPRLMCVFFFYNFILWSNIYLFVDCITTFSVVRLCGIKVNYCIKSVSVWLFRLIIWLFINLSIMRMNSFAYSICAVFNNVNQICFLLKVLQVITNHFSGTKFQVACCKSSSLMQNF
jgi:hypothetical protein